MCVLYVCVCIWPSVFLYACVRVYGIHMCMCVTGTWPEYCDPTAPFNM